MFSKQTPSDSKAKISYPPPSPPKGGKLHWIFLAKKLAKAVAERLVCTKFDENRSIIAILFKHILNNVFQTLKICSGIQGRCLIHGPGPGL